MQKEIYIILDINSKYAISNKGNVKHLKSGNILKLQDNLTGYKICCLSYSKNNQKNHLVHRLVAYCFLQNLDNKPYINHIDGNKKNNNLENLEWCTAKENDTHARDLGLKFKGKPIIARNILTDEKLVFSSCGEGSVHLNINKAFIHRCLKLKYGKSIYKNFEFKYL